MAEIVAACQKSLLYVASQFFLIPQTLGRPQKCPPNVTVALMTVVRPRTVFQRSDFHKYIYIYIY